MDYYSTLGVPKNASQDDIRKAYKKQSMRHHPDRGGDEEQFKKINEAYQNLSDPQKRAAYDNPQPHFEGGMPPGFEDIFAQFGFRQQRSKNPDITLQVELTLKDVVLGKNLIISYQLRNGQEEHVTINVPPGANHGDTVKYQGLGENILPGARGDLFIKLKVTNNTEWRRDRDNLYKTLKVNAFDMILGTAMQLNTVDDRTIELKIPKGTNNGTTFNVTGYGVPNVHNGRRGNLYITVETTIPKNLEERHLQKIKDIRDEIS